MRIGCLQFAPKVGDVNNNIARAEDALSKADPDELQNLDLLVLPEMAFSGYNFKSQEHITPFLEPTGSGPSARWASTTARKYRCTVAVGYPEKTDAGEQATPPEYYNSLVVVDSAGENIAHYRKSFLYYTDATWAREGQGFYGGKLGSLGQAAMGICMDINPYKFESPWDAYEFAFHILKVRANLVILSTAWLTNDEQTTFLSRPDAPDMSTLSYWVRRLEPVIRAKGAEETIVVFANRCGVEDEATYAGTSTVLGIKDGEVSVYGLLGRGVEELLVVDTDKPPFGKIIDKPEVPADGEPGGPAASAEDSHDGPSKDAGPAPGSGYVDSPTLPSGFAPPSRNHAALPLSISTTASTNPRPPHLPKRTTSQSRPKLSVQTNLLPPSPTATSSLRIPARHRLPASPPPHRQDKHSTWNGGLPSAIPIFVDVYTPDQDKPSAHGDDYGRRGLGRSISLDVDGLSPWSVGSSPLGCGGGGVMVPIAASPSIFGGGALGRGVCV